ncbi:uncharacterized protein LOC124491950 [Dermatophagoides farinae]|uniref:Uncharacterized protein n=1 Tax=Dermatophagoides farinae TaxID=6954 RepID=A0A922IEC8_DERFA|nr:uncharacterized protein LOC124491950 [Dermatophagoides farinae]KAH7641320.1 hypothetical protein HUG17_4364 [Dermatophagoides farinae]KAH9527088.1 hypothetical protein DERF_001132 [Dermatophagoides farinae]
MEHHRLLELLLNTFGIIGIQLRPLKLNNSINILNWSINLVINLATLYVLNDQKPFNGRLTRLKSSDQYLMYYFIKSCGLFIFPGICLYYVITYLIYGHRLFRHLQSSTFASIQISLQDMILIFMAPFMIPTVFIWLRSFLLFDSYNLPTFFAIQMIVLYRSITWILLYFIQLANFRVLEQIRQRYLDDDIEKQAIELSNKRKCQSLCVRQTSRCKISASFEKFGKINEQQPRTRHTLKNQSSIIKCRDLFEEMKNLAELNNRLQPICSILLTIHMVYTSTVVTITLNDVAMADFPLNLYYFSDIIQQMIFWFGLSTMNRKVLQNFNRIEGFMLRKLRKVRPNQTLPSTTMTTSTNSSPLKCSKVLKFKEMNIYQQSFHLLLFDVLHIDLKFILDWICFIASYATLIHQTRGMKIQMEN